jgi:prepilin peptidase CpaA
MAVSAAGGAWHATSELHEGSCRVVAGQPGSSSFAVERPGVIHSLQITLAFAGCLLFVCAAWRDLATRTIPNWASLGIAISGIASRGLGGLEAMAWSFGVAVALFAVLVLLHARGWLGGGDVKLLAAAALGLAPALMPRFLLVVALAGGALALAHLMLRRLPGPVRLPSGARWLRRVLTIERWRISHHAPLPYGVAIAAGGIWLLLSGPGGVIR